MKMARLVVLVSLAATLPFLGAAKNVSAAFDGTYKGSFLAVPELSAGTCAPLPDFSFKVAKGRGAGPGVNGKGAISALVTEDGFVTGRLGIAGAAQAFEGRISQGTLLAGVFAGTCAWLMKLDKVE